MRAPDLRAVSTTRSAKVTQVALGLARQRPAGLLEHRQPLFGREQRRLAGMHPDRDHQPVGEPDGMTDNVEMAVGDRVE